MPKASKKKQGKEADFKVSTLLDRRLISFPSRKPSYSRSRQKIKTKLGKGKKVPSNATDTSFKARCR